MTVCYLMRSGPLRPGPNWLPLSLSLSAFLSHLKAAQSWKPPALVTGRDSNRLPANLQARSYQSRICWALRTSWNELLISETSPKPIQTLSSAAPAPPSDYILLDSSDLRSRYIAALSFKMEINNSILRLYNRNKQARPTNNKPAYKLDLWQHLR